MIKKNRLFASLITLVTLLCVGGIVLAGSPLGFSSIQPSGIFEDKVKTGLGIATWIGLIVGVVMVIWVGGKYLMAGAGEKAKAKETLVPMLIGAILIALAPMIINTIYTTMTGS